MQDIEILDLRNGNFQPGQAIPEGVRELILNKNELTSLNGIVFPESLKILRLLGCGITSIDDADFPSGLQQIYLGENKIESLAPGVLPDGIEQVFLNHNRISSLANVNLPDSVLEFSCKANLLQSLAGFVYPINLKFFEAAENAITSIEPNVFLDSLEKIDLGQNPITELKISILPRGLKYCYFGHEDLTFADFGPFPPALEDFVIQGAKNIKSLDSFTFPETLKILDFSNTGLSSLSGAIFPDDLEEIIINDTLITSFAGVEFPMGLKVIEACAMRLESLDGFVAPAGLNELVVTSNTNLAISRESLIELSDTMLNKVAADQNLECYEMVQAFNDHQRNKIKSTMEFAKGFDPSSAVDLANIHKIFQALFYAENCFHEDEEFFDFLSGEDVAKLESFIPELYGVTLVTESECEFEKDFYFASKKRGAEDVREDAGSRKRLRAEEPAEELAEDGDVIFASLVTGASGDGNALGSVLPFDLGQIFFEEFDFIGESFDMDDIG